MVASHTSTRTVKFAKLPRSVQEKEVRCLAARIGTVVSVTIVRTKSDESSSHALVAVEWNERSSSGVQWARDVVANGGFLGRHNVTVEVLPDAVKKKSASKKARKTQKVGNVTSAGRTAEVASGGRALWELGKRLAKEFHLYVNSNADILLRCSDRKEMGHVYNDWRTTVDAPLPNNRHAERSLVLAALRRMRLMRSANTDNLEVLSFAGLDGPGNFNASEKPDQAKERALLNRQEAESDKEGVVVSNPALQDVLVMPLHSHSVAFQISSLHLVHLQSVHISGVHARAFSAHAPSKVIVPGSPASVTVKFRSPNIGMYQCTLTFHFKALSVGNKFSISRFVTLHSGDSVLAGALKPAVPYEKKKRFTKKKVDTMFEAPLFSEQKSSLYSVLPHHKAPFHLKELIANKEIDSLIVQPQNSIDCYAAFWKYMLWANEYQANIDIALFDMENVTMRREGQFSLLAVPSLAEGYPSVLKGDIVEIKSQRVLYKGRVQALRLSDVVLDLHPSFAQSSRAISDPVNVKFTISRTTFRTSHEGCKAAPLSMGSRMLLPEPHDLDNLAPRSLRSINWANRDLNHEQKSAVENILLGEARPLPYIIFGPPGTGKTTTLTEAVYQLAKHPDNLKLLVVAPSNDAADVLVKKLAPYFPPSGMRRVLAFTRDVETVLDTVRPYCEKDLSEVEEVRKIKSMRIVVCTLNYAARLLYKGVKSGHFDVLCVDEAGHATEPEVIAVAATLMDFQRCDGRVGQLILAGDPKQLGPVVTSEMCRKFGMSDSYMQRLTERDVYGRTPIDNQYPPDLLTKLVRNYRSHPTIMVLPNEMFYDNELIMCGDRMNTHSMSQWKHLPAKGFPIVVHAVHGQNLREGNSPSWFNPQEAQQVISYVDLLVKQSRPAVDPKDIGIITPYAKQAQKISLALKIMNIQNVKVGSVETFQGQERRVIILSTVRAESELMKVDAKYNLGFVSNEKRFNVAVTRAQSLLIVVCHPKVLATDKKHWLPLLKLAKENGSWLGQDWDSNEVPDNDLEEHVSDDDLEENVSDDDSEENVSDDDLEENVSDDDLEENVSDNDDEWNLIDEASHAVEQEGIGYPNSEE